MKQSPVEDALVVGDFKERYNDRLTNLEGALKQSEYERLIFQESNSRL